MASAGRCRQRRPATPQSSAAPPAALHRLPRAGRPAARVWPTRQPRAC